MGFFSSLFGGAKTEPVQETVEPVEYKEFLIYPEAKAESGQFRVAGRICKPTTDDSEDKEHLFIRSDVLMTKDDANELMIRKAKMFIDQMGDKIFS
ncbi:HlyU family transcriptional regulator [Vibrio viridaestus]|uniref:Transcriptional regulator n=1 Tax=Vibrio viridaestus TaxID=2487322 RepID=A0A3N9TC71_9VIBR|nr:HlyU family transcriptional regulator [Vibrio viridaestus]RQW61797.1 transcriptional regulator [Vibrio viridaestus]